MSGHSKWSTIKRKKEKTDSQRAKIFTKIGRELAVVVKEGGTDPNINTKLKDCIAKAKSNNVPNDNIERIIKKAAGGSDANKYESITYEGYGPNGIAVIVETLTDNRNRTAADLRHYFDKFGGNMGTPGCVSFMFDKKGVIVIEKEGLDEDKVMEGALDSGAEDFIPEEEVFIIHTKPSDCGEIRENLASMGYKIASAEVEMVPSTYVSLKDEESITKMQKLLDMLEDNDDVQDIWHNWETEE